MIDIDSAPIRRVIMIVLVCPYCDSTNVMEPETGGYQCLDCHGYAHEHPDWCAE